MNSEAQGEADMWGEVSKLRREVDSRRAICHLTQSRNTGVQHLGGRWRLMAKNDEIAGTAGMALFQHLSSSHDIFRWHCLGLGHASNSSRSASSRPPPLLYDMAKVCPREPKMARL